MLVSTSLAGGSKGSGDRGARAATDRLSVLLNYLIVEKNIYHIIYYYNI